ncbi:hypothetical protein SHIRM173S_04098 [Streptomyces hirsutus]
MQNYLLDERGRIRWRTPEDGGLPPSGTAIVSPYDTQARYSRRGHATRWKGYLTHVTESCDKNGTNVITDVATTGATEHDSRALPEIHHRLARRRPLPAEHLIDSGYTTLVHQDRALRFHQVELVGPVRGNPTRQHREQGGFGRDVFRIDFEQRQVTCPHGQTSRAWYGPYPTSSPQAAPLIVVKFAKSQCGPCPARSKCTSSRAASRSVGFPPKDLLDLQRRAGAEHDGADRRSIYALRSGCRRHCQRARARPRDAAMPLPRTRQDPCPARSHRHRGEHRTALDRFLACGTGPSTPAADCVPDPPGPAGDPPTSLLALRRWMRPATPRSPTESSSGVGVAASTWHLVRGSMMYSRPVAGACGNGRYGHGWGRRIK